MVQYRYYTSKYKRGLVKVTNLKSGTIINYYDGWFALYFPNQYNDKNFLEMEIEALADYVAYATACS